MNDSKLQDALPIVILYGDMKGKNPCEERYTVDEQFSDYLIHTVHLPEGYVSDALEPIFRNWTPSEPVLIEAGTGCGKSHFVLNNLYDFVASNNQRMLVVSNRIALSNQYKVSLLERLDSPLLKELTPEGIQNRQDFGPVYFTSYQGLAGIIKKCREGEMSFDWLVCDEAHYFTADSLFARDTGWLMEQIPKTFRTAIRIYMTATPHLVQALISRTECELEPTPENRFFAAFYGTPLDIRTSITKYHIPQPQRNYVLHYLPSSVRDNLADPALTELIEGTPSSEKWLIFTESKTKGKKFKDHLGKDAVYLDSEQKSSRLWQRLTSGKGFNARILISTQVLDCGVNIADPALTHVVLLTTDHTQFIQELGRKRLADGEEVNVYVPELSERQLDQLIEHNEHYVKHIERLLEADAKEQYAIRADLWYGDDHSLRCISPLDAHGKLTLNRGAVYQVYHIQRQLQRLKADTGDHAFVREVARWLGQGDTFSEEKWIFHRANEQLKEQAEAELLNALERYKGIPLSDEEQKAEFRNTIGSLCRAAGLKRNTERNDRPLWGLHALRNALEPLGYSIVSTKKSWTLKENDRKEHEE